MGDFNARLHRRKGVSLATTVAVHSDLAVVNDKGGEGEAFSIVGTVLNVVDQLEGLAGPDQVVVSEETYRLVKAHVDCETLGPQNLKGVAGAKEVYRAVAERAGPVPVEAGEATARNAVIGRDREIGLLQERWDQAAEGLGQVVLVCGEAGIGKSRLSGALKEYVGQAASRSTHSTASAGALGPVVEWRAAPHCQNSSLYPAVDYFERLLAFAPGDAPGQRLDRLSQHLRELGLHGDEEVALLASLLSVPLDGRCPAARTQPAPAEGEDPRSAAGLAARLRRPLARAVRRRRPALGRPDDAGVPRSPRRAVRRRPRAGAADVPAGVRGAVEEQGAPDADRPQPPDAAADRRTDGAAVGDRQPAAAGR